MSGGGECLNYLNKWERLVFYLDTLCVDINSDGIQLLEQVQAKMKRHIEDFEDEESFYYELVEQDLLTGLYQYIIQNKTKFR